MNPILINLNSYKDERGEFYESYKDILLKQYFIDFNMIQENTCISNKYVIRGFHFQKEPHSQAKLLQVLNGKIIDIVINLETNEILKYVLDSKEKQLLYIPKGFAHGYGVLEDNTIVSYKTDNIYNKESEDGFNPYSLNIDWGINDPIISEKDNNLNYL
jgi:dTDP-4-dehydrorhamnose 3,5-epimerase